MNPKPCQSGSQLVMVQWKVANNICNQWSRKTTAWLYKSNVDPTRATQRWRGVMNWCSCVVVKHVYLDSLRNIHIPSKTRISIICGTLCITTIISQQKKYLPSSNEQAMREISPIGVMMKNTSSCASRLPSSFPF